MLCTRVENLLSAYCDRELTGEDMLRVRQHLSGCPSCRQEYETLHRFKRLLSAAPAAEPAAPFRMELLEARLQSGASYRRSRVLDNLRLACLDRFHSVRTPLVNLLHHPVSTRRLVTGGAVAVAVVAAALVQRSQLPDAVTAHVPVAITLDRAPILPLPTREDAAYSAPGLEPVYYQYYTGNQLTHVGPDDLMPWDGRMSASVNLVNWQPVQKHR